MSGTNEDRLKAYLQRDNSFLGRVVNDVLDTARTAVGKPGLWIEAFQYEQRQASLPLPGGALAEAVENTADKAAALESAEVAERLVAEMTQGANQMAMDLAPAREAVERGRGGR